ncbi:uncharacterized protein BO88DRAFT_476686 [Aspergillus vadensis CBS 113365]|uniref:Mid2 domain-containing protein n=1 Tax=Aspergillus vadensis (strain CBS 113365 / IMI 142717 / IBT 24658) TaxID=1448311 RepID=A0A319BHB3_ASPVC|nr:hypothetical protein BO88DRAFT_476686 [Aspergillus vadensis CBS 113365]PYH72175.1 hypothetical protein BO88DRAFT_476686 [Aspergillus vadensis CBS 113365]
MKINTGTFWALIPSYVSLAAASSCYAPDGSLVDSSIYQPCVSISGVHSMCCKLNDADPDTCDPSGLCQTSGGAYYREFCTDQSWNSTNCLPKDICGNQNGGNSDWTYQLTNCGDGSWCCGSTTACCNTYETFTLDSALLKFSSNDDSNSNSNSGSNSNSKSGSSSNSGSGSDSNSASDGSSTSAPTTTGTGSPLGDSSRGINSEPDQSDPEKSKRLAIGLGVGLPLACIAVAMLGAGYVWGRRDMKKELQPKFQPRIINLPLEKPKGEIGCPRPADDGSSVSHCLEIVRSP